MALTTYTAAPKTKAPAIPGNTGYGLLNPGTTTPGTTTPNLGGYGGTGVTGTTGNTSVPQVDYMQLLKNDPLLGQANANIAASGVANQANLTAARRAALIQYGQVPTNLSTAVGNVGSDIDQTTRDLAAQGTKGGVTTVARLLKAYQQNQQGDLASLAARGLLRSGATGQHLSEDLSNYNIAGYDAQNQLLNYLNGLWSGYQQQQQALQAQQLQAQNDALNRIIAQINAGMLSGGRSGVDDGGGGNGGGGNGGGGNDKTPPPIADLQLPHIMPRTGKAVYA